MAICSAEGAPAEPPMTAAWRMPSASSRHTWASACAAAEASEGMGVRRYPKRDMAITRMPSAAKAPAKAMPWS